MTPITAIVSSVWVGWMVAAPIGPVNVEIIRRTLRDGPQCGMAVGCGAVLIDTLYLSAFAAGLGSAMSQPMASRALALAGGAFLGYLGFRAVREGVAIWRQQRGLHTVTEAHPAEQIAEIDSTFTRSNSRHWSAGLLAGLIMTGTNPMTLVFWSALSLRYAPLPVSERWWSSLGVLIGCSSWVAFLVGVLAYLRRWVGPRFLAMATLAGGLCLVALALKLLLSAAGLA